MGRESGPGGGREEQVGAHILYSYQVAGLSGPCRQSCLLWHTGWALARSTGTGVEHALSAHSIRSD
jgi:hypothetical protein